MNLLQNMRRFVRRESGRRGKRLDSSVAKSRLDKPRRGVQTSVNKPNAGVHFNRIPMLVVFALQIIDIAMGIEKPLTHLIYKYQCALWPGVSRVSKGFSCKGVKATSSCETTATGISESCCTCSSQRQNRCCSAESRVSRTHFYFRGIK